MEQVQELVAENEDNGGESVILPKEAFAKLCCMVHFNQLKLFRLVCREWNNQVSTHPRIRECTGVLRQDWLYKARGINFESTLPWKSVFFYFFPFNRNNLFPDYWKQTGEYVTKLQFKYVKISCDRMVSFLAAMPLLEDVTFSQCNFEVTKLKVNEEDRNWRTNNKTRYIKCACPHENCVLPEGSVMPPPRIRRLVFVKEDYFPLCILDMLTQRTTGVLEELQYNHARLARWRRRYYRPVPEHVELRIYEIARRNVNTIRRFSFFRNFRGDVFLTRLMTNHLNFPLERAVLGQQASWTHMETAEQFIEYLNSLNADTLQELSWRFIHRFQGELLSAAIADKRELRYIFIDTVWCAHADHNAVDNVHQVDFSVILPPLTKLETLHVRDRNRRRHPSMKTNYLDFLPKSVKALLFYGYYIPDAKIRTFVQSNSARQLQTLSIEGGRYVTNETMQIIITSLPQLEVLTVNDSRYMTDSGVIGLPEEACKTIIYCQQRAILSGNVPVDKSLMKHSVSEMKNLKRLSFAGCRKLSDISIFMGIKFPHIEEVDMSRCLNVTDLGLLILAKNNPTLKRIVVIKNYKITHYGLNLVLETNQAIANIHTSKKVRNRNLGKQLQYKLVDRFNTAVTYCRWDERRARPMFTD